MRPHALPVSGAGGRRGFTLVEILVAVTIMSILAAMLSAALIVARNSAREAATKATILKLHALTMAKYDSYLTRRVPIIPAGPMQTQAVRILELRDLMRMEMPERVTDICQLNGNGDIVGVRGPLYPVPYPAAGSLPVPAVLQAYYARVNGSIPGCPGWSSSGSRAAAPGECLYMIVMMTCGADARRQFHESEIKDTDGNGLPEFVDGWGKPIYFLRWAPAFTDSDVQANVVLQSDLDATTPGNESAAWTNSVDPHNVMGRRQLAAQNDHDRLDSSLVNMAAPSDVPYVPCGSRLVPLIYSAGPDGEYGIAIDTPNGSAPYVWQEYAVPGSNPPRFYGGEFLSGWGLPIRNADGAWVHFDNITNHHLEAD